MNAIRSWEANLGRRLGGGIIAFDKTTVGKTLHVPCAVGKHLVDFKVRANLDPNGTVKQMIHAGWTIGRRRLVCPDCKRNNEQAKADRRRGLMSGSSLSDEGTGLPPEQPIVPEPRPKNPGKVAAGKARQAQVTLEQRREWGRIGGFRKHENRLKREGKVPSAPTPELREKEPVMAQEQGTATDKARAAKREAMDLLSLAFKLASDSKSGQYQDGYSDARIAKETGLSEQAVCQLREEFFGPLGEPDELRAVRDDLAKMRGNLEGIRLGCEQEIARIERKLTAVCQKQGWAVA